MSILGLRHTLNYDNNGFKIYEEILLSIKCMRIINTVQMLQTLLHECEMIEVLT